MEKKAVPVDRGLVLIRSPYEAILANFNREGDIRGNATLKYEYSSRKRFEKGESLSTEGNGRLEGFKSKQSI